VHLPGGKLKVDTDITTSDDIIRVLDLDTFDEDPSIFLDDLVHLILTNMSSLSLQTSGGLRRSVRVC
jgi:hypothetical protein